MTWTPPGSGTSGPANEGFSPPSGSPTGASAAQIDHLGAKSGSAGSTTSSLTTTALPVSSCPVTTRRARIKPTCSSCSQGVRPASFEHDNRPRGRVRPRPTHVVRAVLVAQEARQLNEPRVPHHAVLVVIDGGVGDDPAAGDTLDSRVSLVRAVRPNLAE